jgi:hypothetical protein
VGHCCIVGPHLLRWVKMAIFVSSIHCEPGVQDLLHGLPDCFGRRYTKCIKYMQSSLRLLEYLQRGRTTPALHRHTVIQIDDSLHFDTRSMFCGFPDEGMRVVYEGDER